MRKHLLLLPALLAWAPVAFGQLDSSTISVTAKRALTATADRVDIRITANAPGNATLDAVLDALPGSRLTAANLAADYTPVERSGDFSFAPVGSFDISRTTTWSFVRTVPLADFNETLDLLIRLQPKSGVSLNISASAAAAPRPACPWQRLLADAQTQAQKIAGAAGVRLGPLVALADRAEPEAVRPSSVIFGFALAGAPLSVAPAGPPPPCSLTAQFQLLR